MGRDTLEKETWQTRWKRESLPKLRVFDVERNRLKREKEQAERHKAFSLRDMIKQIKWRCEMKLTVDNRAAIGLCKILLDKYV